MSIEYHILNAAKFLTGIEKCRIQDALAEGVQKASDLLAVRDVDIIVRCQPDVCEPNLPAHGYTPPDDGHLILITMDPKTEFYRTNQGLRYLSSIGAHEMNHIARIRGPGFGINVLEWLASEGLAQKFEEQTGHCPNLYSFALTTSGLVAFSAQIRQRLNDEIPYDLLFQGSFDDKNYPKWGGYSLGYALVSNWYEKNGNPSPSEAIQLPARDILEEWRKTGEIAPVRPASVPFGKASTLRATHT
jgi:hypothetical protein